LLCVTVSGLSFISIFVRSNTSRLLSLNFSISTTRVRAHAFVLAQCRRPLCLIPTIWLPLSPTTLLLTIHSTQSRFSSCTGSDVFKLAFLNQISSVLFPSNPSDLSFQSLAFSQPSTAPFSSPFEASLPPPSPSEPLPSGALFCHRSYRPKH